MAETHSGLDGSIHSIEMKKDTIPYARPSSPSTLPNAPDPDIKGNELVHTATHQSYSISLSEVEPVDVCTRNLAVDVDVSPSLVSVAGISAKFSRRTKKDDEGHGGDKRPTTKTILYDVSADMPRGTLTAIIGGSGSGKTSLLNTMADRMSSGRLTFGGTTTFNGKLGINSVRSAYVMQQDILLPTLTVRETLQYSADLRLPPPTTAEERKRVVNEVILELGLKECADTRIGNHTHKGCSGGEKRRTSIGVQMLSNPSVLFLDEPTTGLDATSAFQLMKTLKSLAKKGRTIITTIHQPRSEIWGLLDNLVILSRGSPVYSGPLSKCIPYFADQSMELPAFVNPAEFVIDIAAVDNRSPELEEVSSERVRRLKDAWQQKSLKFFGSDQEKDLTVVSSDSPTSSKEQRHSAFTRQVRVLTARTFVTTIRDPMGVSGLMMEAILMGIINGWIYLYVGSDQAGIRSREAALYTVVGLQGYLMLMYETYRVSIDIAIFDREHGERVVDVIPFLLSRRLAKFLLEDLPVPLIFCTIFYWMAYFRNDSTQYLIFLGINLLNHYVAITFSTVCVALERSFAGASIFANLMFTLQAMTCGYFLQVNTIPIYVRWLKWTAYLFYGFGALCANEFVGHFYDCPLPGGESNPACLQYTGLYIMDSLGLPHDWVLRPIIILLAFVILFDILAALLLRFKPVHISIAQARNSEADLSAGKEKAAEQEAETRRVNIRLDKFSLDLDKRTIWGKRLPTKTILEPITANFQPGLLNVIMGPSGSGKTSLLNLMALRLHNSLGTKYRSYGKMTFNGAVPSDSVIRSVCSYVCQDDDALLPSLTVRETLRFAAGLRLPSHMSRAEKRRRAEAILMRMGLKDCADNVIGNDLIKGISGGEKRRVSIAIQILTDPLVLLLDEPTSGLDAFTANSIMSVLQGLAAEGRTLILTIHQSRSDLFKHFGTVLLLARGGSPCYAGPGSNMLPHFTALGHPCPTTTNPADFALDLITIDLQHSVREEESRSKVRSLITSWASADFAAATAHTTIATPAELGALKRKMTPFHISYPILVHRSITNIFRQPAILLARTMQVIGLGGINTLFYAPLGNDYFSIQNRLGFIQQLCATYFVGMLTNVAVYPTEKEVFYREHDDGAYSVEAFFATYTTCEIPFTIFTCLVFAIMTCLGAGMPRTAQVYFATFFDIFCTVTCGESLGIMFNTLFRHTGFAINLVSILLSLAMTMSGILSIHMPAVLQGLNYLSPLRYLVRNLVPYSIRDQIFTCTDQQRLPDGNCTIGTGIEVLRLYELDVDPLVNVIALAGVTVVYRAIAWAVLRLARGRR